MRTYLLRMESLAGFRISARRRESAQRKLDASRPRMHVTFSLYIHRLYQRLYARAGETGQRSKQHGWRARRAAAKYGVLSFESPLNASLTQAGRACMSPFPYTSTDCINDRAALIFAPRSSQHLALLLSSPSGALAIAPTY
jgi:ribosomal protein L34